MAATRIATRCATSAGIIFVLAALLPAAHADDRSDWRNKMRAIVPHGYVSPHTTEPPRIDGQLDDRAWAAVPWTTDFVDIEGAAKPAPRFRTRAKMLWDDDYLYVAAELTEPHVWGTLTAHDSVIFRDNDFEVFIDPDGDTHAYYEFEINALNTGWDLQLVKPYMDGGPARNEWEIPGLKTAVHIQGTLNDAFDTDRGWTVELAFPWKVLGEHARHPGPPTEGEQWRINFSRVQWQVTTDGTNYRKVPNTPEDNWVWSPQGVIDMHRPEIWGVLQFTRRPAEESSVTRLAGKAAHDLALEVYYAQRDFFKAHERWATTLAELGWDSRELPPDAEQPVLRITSDGYVCEVAFTNGDRRNVWRISQDRHLSCESP